MSGYGFLAGLRMAPNHRAEPLAHEITIRYRAQSMLTRNGIVPPLPSYEEAQRILARANKPRIRIPVTVPEPLSNLPASPDACSRVQVGAGRQSIHSSPCDCDDDAQRHYALVARDLMALGRADELTDDMRQAYDYEFGGVPEPEPQQVPEF